MNSLAVFEMAARHLSFTRAAEEPTISREAVSRPIRGLEDYLGVALFQRKHRALELTDAGHRFRTTAEESLDRIRASARSLRNSNVPATVTVFATLAISSFWLSPRLSRFRMRAPDVPIRILASDQLPDFQGANIDVGLVYGDGSWAGLNAWPLFSVRSFPICAPDYLRHAGAIERPDDLRNHTLLNLEGGQHSSEDWVWWFGQFGNVSVKDLQIVGFDNYTSIVQAALEGQGVALGFSGLIDALIERGSLIRPIDTTLNPGRSVYLVTPESGTENAMIPRFLNWIAEETYARS